MSLLYLRNLNTTGAFVPTTGRVEKEITKNIGQKQFIVVELGMGLGNITKKILKKLHPNGQLIAFEINSQFCEMVNKEIRDKRLTIINDSAGNIKNYIDGEINIVISSLPLSIIDAADNIFKDLSDLMTDNSVLSQVLLRKNGFKTIENYFEIQSISTVGFFPCYHITHFFKKNSQKETTNF